MHDRQWSKIFYQRHALFFVIVRHNLNAPIHLADKFPVRDTPPRGPWPASAEGC